MPDGDANIEIAKHPGERGGRAEGGGPSRRRIEMVEILGSVLLAIVAPATALSGYQAARWDGESAKDYATSSISYPHT